jgi:nitrogen fixation protein FixH
MTVSAGRRLTGRAVLLIALGAFGVVILANAVLAFYAVGTFSGLVVPNSYIASQDFDRRRDAQIALGWTVGLDYSDGVLGMTMKDATDRTVRPETLSVSLGRPTQQRDDRTLDLQATLDGVAAPVLLAPGNWRIEISATAEDGTLFHQSRAIYVPEP